MTPPLRDSAVVAVTPPGQPFATWAPTIKGAPTRQLADLAAGGSGRLVVLSAHPDDETIGAGRLIAGWCDQVGPALAITVTAGEACVEHLGIRLPGLARRRVAEWTEATKALGAEPISCWGVSDGHVDTAVDEVVRRLAERLRPGDLLLAPWRHDPHPDHAAVGVAAGQAAALCGAAALEYPVWMTYWSQPSELQHTAYRLQRVRTDPEAQRRRGEALTRYRSQQEPLRPDLLPVVPADLLAHHRVQMVLVPAESDHD